MFFIDLPSFVRLGSKCVFSDGQFVTVLVKRKHAESKKRDDYSKQSSHIGKHIIDFSILSLEKSMFS